MTNEDMLKLAYAQGASLALEETGLVKEALGVGSALGWLAKGVGKLSPRAAKYLPGVTAKGKYVPRIAKGVGSGALMGGTLFGGLNALSAPEGERMKSFVKGFVPGALSFGAWGLGSNIGRAAWNSGTRGLLGKNVAGKINRSAATPFFSHQRWLPKLLGGKEKLPAHMVEAANKQTPTILKQLMTKGQRTSGLGAIGAKAYKGTIPLGTGMVLSSGVDSLMEPAPPSMPAATVYHMGRQGMMGHRGMGLTPSGGYNNGSSYF